VVEGVPLWLDRPGFGDSHFNFDTNYIERHDIAGLRAGRPFDRQILEALWDCDAVLGCLSRVLTQDRQVLVQELVLATYANKLVTCIVDDLPYGDIPSDLGLIDASRLQAPRIDTVAIDKAVELIDAGRCTHPDELPLDLLRPWQVVRELVAEIKRVSGQSRLPRLSLGNAQALRTQLIAVPIGPAVRPWEIPVEIIIALGSQLAKADAAMLHMQMAMQLVLACNPELFEPRQIIITVGEVIPLDKNTPETYWADVLTVAGMKSRRTLAALLCAPTGLRAGQTSSSTAAVVESFMAWLQQP